MTCSVLQLRRRAALRWAIRYLGYVSLWVGILVIIYAYPFVPSWYAWLFDPSYRPQMSIPALPLPSWIHNIPMNASDTMLIVKTFFQNFIFWSSSSQLPRSLVESDPLMKELTTLFSSSSCGFPSQLSTSHPLKTMTSASLAILLTQELGVQRIEDLLLLTMEDITEKLHLPIIQQRKFVTCLCKLQWSQEEILPSSGLCQLTI
jgi:hypothetical protein